MNNYELQQDITYQKRMGMYEDTSAYSWKPFDFKKTPRQQCEEYMNSTECIEFEKNVFLNHSLLNE